MSTIAWPAITSVSLMALAIVLLAWRVSRQRRAPRLNRSTQRLRPYRGSDLRAFEADQAAVRSAVRPEGARQPVERKAPPPTVLPNVTVGGSRLLAGQGWRPQGQQSLDELLLGANAPAEPAANEAQAEPRQVHAG
jgi:hypothetical protein